MDAISSLQQGHILIVDDDQDVLTAGKLLLKRHFEQVDTCDSPTQLPALLAGADYSVIMLDMNFRIGQSKGAEGLYWLKKILRSDPDAVVVPVTAYGGVDIAVEAMKLGATDFIAKPWQNEKLVATLSAGVKLRKSRREAAALRQSNHVLIESVGGGSQPMLGSSRAMQRVVYLIDRAAPTEANVLILGENGTGKELAARRLHRHSLRSDRVFISVDLGAISETLFEAELFGHKKGAFTGAVQDRMGYMQAADGGTLFLDEIGNLPLHLQAKLLTALEQKKVTPVGSSKAEAVDVRIVAATNQVRSKLLDERFFRQDLLFRLNTVEIILPPLRQRQEDIPVIAEHYARIYCKKYNRGPMEFSPSALRALMDYSWPGNIRALRHAIERAVILCEGDCFEVDDFKGHGDEVESAREPHRDEEELNLDQLELRAIQRALQRHRYNISHAAKELGLTRAALYRRMEKHKL